jgi:cyclopropane-fatty-acyl-phospholipid synthase
MPDKKEQAVRALFARAGIEVGGTRPWDIRVHDPRFYDRLLAQGSLGAGESYMEGWWECDALDEMFLRAFSSDLVEQIRHNWTLLLHLLEARVLNLQNHIRSREVARRHYDLSNDFYQMMLGETMAYTCAYWKEATELDSAQWAKYDLVCRKLKLREGESLLELGCGWGGFARYAAEHYGCRVTAVNISEPQVAFARDWCRGLQVQVHLCDYRSHDSYNPTAMRYHKVASIGMAEHVGPKNHRTWLTTVHRQLAPDGLFLIHTIGSDRSLTSCDPFTDKYLFPGSVRPSIRQLGDASDGLFIWEDLQNFGTYYHPTARAWQANVERHWDAIQALDRSRFDQRFFRMWSFYLKASMGMARSREAQLWQIVLAPKGPRQRYECER